MEIEVKDGIVGKAIGRTNRNILLASILAIILVIGFIAVGFNYWSTLLGGPRTPTHDELTNKVKIDFLPTFVTVSGEAIDTGYEQYVIEDDGSRTTENYYIAILLDNDKILLTETRSSEIFDSYTGALINVPSDIQLEVIGDIVREYPDLDGYFLPVMMTLDDHRTAGYIALVVMAIMFFAALYRIFNVMGRKADITKHPIMKSLGRYGEPELIVKEIEGEMALGSEKYGKLQVTPKWAVCSTATTFEAMRMKDIVWMYKMITQHRINGIPTGKTYQAMFYDKHGKKMTVPGKQDVVDSILEGVYRHAPWIIAGHSPDLQKAWNDKQGRTEMIAAVEQRQNQ